MRHPGGHRWPILELIHSRCHARYVKFVAALCCLASLYSVHSEPLNLTPNLPGAKQPQLAVGPEENVFITFGRENAIFFMKSVNGGDSFGQPRKVAELKQLALGMRRGPRIASSGKLITITAISHSDGNLYAWNSDDHGDTWSARATINTVPKSAREGMHDLAAHQNGQASVVWLDLRHGKTELFGAHSNDGGQSWQPNTLIYKSPSGTICECCHPTARFTPEGDLVVMWRNSLDGSRDLYRAISTDRGRAFSPAAKLGTGTWPLQACPMDGGHLAISPEGPVYAWRREQRLYATTPNSQEVLIAEEGTHPVVVSAPPQLHLFWQNQGDLYWKQNLRATPALLANNAAFVSALHLPARGKTLAAWEQTENNQTFVFFQRLP